AAARDERELPAEVPRVLDAGVHALRTDGAVDVRGVAGKEEAAGAVVRDLPVVQAEAAEPSGVAQAHAAAGRGVGRGLELCEREVVRARPLVGPGPQPAGRHEADEPPRA